jgi:20S proteasome alpha/beta subunit
LDNQVRDETGAYAKFMSLSSKLILESNTPVQVMFENQQGVQIASLPLGRARVMAKDAFTSATERDIYTGDCLEISIITKDGVTVEKMDLKKD